MTLAPLYIACVILVSHVPDVWSTCLFCNEAVTSDSIYTTAGRERWNTVFTMENVSPRLFLVTYMRDIVPVLGSC